MQRKKLKFLGIPVSLFIGFEAAILPYLAFIGNREYTWVLIPLSLYTTYFLTMKYIARWWKNGHVFVVIHLIITGLYLPGMFTAYNPYAITSIALAFFHLIFEYLTREKEGKDSRVSKKVLRRKRTIAVGRSKKTISGLHYES